MLRKSTRKTRKCIKGAGRVFVAALTKSQKQRAVERRTETQKPGKKLQAKICGVRNMVYDVRALATYYTCSTAFKHNAPERTRRVLFKGRELPVGTSTFY